MSSSKREYLLQKGLHLQQLTTEGTTTTGETSSSSKTSRDVAKIRDLCPPGTEDTHLIRLVEHTKGDSTRIERAISELWEDYRGAGQNDWAVVAKKGKKKVETPAPTSRHTRSSPQEAQPEDDSSRARNSNTRGRGAASSRGGRGGGRVRGRGALTTGAPSTRLNAATDNSNTDENVENDDGSARPSSPVRQHKDKQTTVTATSTTTVKKAAVVVAVAPPRVDPVLTGAWAKKPNLGGIGAKPKEAALVGVVAAATKAVAHEKKDAHSQQKQPASPVKKTMAEVVASPTKKNAPSTPAKAVEQKSAPAPTAGVLSPKAKIKSPVKVAVETTTTTTSITSGWGSLDVATSSLSDWPAQSDNKPVSAKPAATTNAWARGSPITTPAVTLGSPRPTVLPGSPKDIQVPRSPINNNNGSSTSPKQYLKLGKWESAASTNLGLQFGSFSLNSDIAESSSSPRGWASSSSTTTTTIKSSTSETQSAWGTATTTSSSSPKKKQTPASPVRHADADQHSAHDNTSARKSAAPPGLSVESGRLTPKSSQSPRTYAPSAPSPASLPKPDDVKRTPTRNFQSQAANQSQASSKIGGGSGYSSTNSGLYQAYGQYSMDIVGRGGAAAPTSGSAQVQHQTSSNTPKNSAGRNVGGAATTAVHSPSHGPQASTQAQQHQLQMQQQAQQQQQQQQLHAQQQQQQQQKQSQAPQQQAQQQGHQQQPTPQQMQQVQGGPQGYHPHYAPPPPPGMALPYNPYSYANYYQGYGYYQNPQYAQYNPRGQYPPRGSIPYGVEGPIPGFAASPSMPVGYQDQHLLAHQHEYAAGIPQGFGEITGAYAPPLQQQQGHHHHGHQQGGPQSHGGKGSSANSTGQQSQQPHGQRSNNSAQGYQNAAAGGARGDHGTTPPGSASGSAAAGYAAAQHYGWASYGGQPMGGWGHMGPQSYQPNPAASQHQHPGSHQQSYRQYANNNNAQASNGGANEAGSTGTHTQAWTS